MQKITTNHAEIKAWAKRNSGKPQLTPNEEAGQDEVQLRIDFPGIGDDLFLNDANPPQDIPWSEFFEVFEKENLAFIYQPEVSRGDLSLQYHFIKRNHAKSILNKNL